MGKELLLVAEAVSNEKGVEKEIVLDAIQAAIESATRKKAGADIGVRVQLDPETGDYETFRYWDIVADLDYENPELHITIEDAEEQDLGVEIGDRIEEAMESIDFGRRAARDAKQMIVQKLREEEARLIIERYTKRIGELVTGQVKRTTRDNVILELGGHAEALLPRSELIPGEIFRPSDRVRAYLYAVEAGPRGAQLLVSRTHRNMLTELFRIEVPEIGEEVIEMKSAARDAGSRAKIAVKTNDGRIDPIGACVGMRGSRVQAVSGELGGERVDIILWDDNPAQLVINSLSPAEVASIIVDEDSHTMDIAVTQDYLSQAIGRNGQNIRLASELTGWTLNVMSTDEFAEKNQAESKSLVDLFAEQLNVEEDVAQILVEAGFSTLEEVAYVAEKDMAEIDGFDEEIVTELRSRANDVLLTKALSDEEKLGDVEPAEDLLTMEGMDPRLAYKLAAKGVVCMEDLAEQSVDELLEIDGIDEKTAGVLIMKAREPWFAE